MSEGEGTEVRARQDPLRSRYRDKPRDALIVDRARTAGGSDTDPFHGTVVPGSEDYGVEWPFGIHHAVGGYHDEPNPGDILCAALASCLDSTIRIIANRLEVHITSLEVDVTAKVDVRGTLKVHRETAVGFQEMRCDVSIETEEGTDPRLLKTLLAGAEQSCINLRTLRSGVDIDTVVHSD